jgi:hypothetical protein
MINSVGYVKDALAVIGFVGAFILVYGATNLHKVKSVILASLLLAIIIDGAFTACPGYHHRVLGYNAPTYLLGATVLAFVPLLIRFFKTH